MSIQSRHDAQSMFHIIFTAFESWDGGVRYDRTQGLIRCLSTECLTNIVNSVKESESILGKIPLNSALSIIIRLIRNEHSTRTTQDDTTESEQASN